MGVDIYMEWDGKTKEDQEQQQYTGFANAGQYGYLTGAYFGGHSDVMRFLFDWMDWDEGTPFDPVKFEQKLVLLEYSNGHRPGKGKWKHMENADRGWDSLHARQETNVDEETLQEYRAFLEFGKKLISEGKNPKVYISY